MIKKIIGKVYKKIFVGLKRLVIHFLYFNFLTKAKNKKVSFSNIENVLIIAHPDDEMIFFHKFLAENKKTLVICLTNGGCKIRSNEFYNSINYYGVKGIMFNFKDGNNIIWNSVIIKRQLLKILNQINFSVVLTHNKEGEYGHKQHIQCFLLLKDIKYLLSSSVVFLTPDNNLSIFKKKNKLTELQLNEKITAFKNIYKSQSKLILNKDFVFYNYFVYENLIKKM